MDRNIRIAKQLVKLAKSLVAGEPRYLSDDDIAQKFSGLWLSEFQCDGVYEQSIGRRYDVCAVVQFPNADEDDGGDFDNSRSVWYKVDADKMDACGSNVNEISALLLNAGDQNGIWLPDNEMKALCDMLAKCWVKISPDASGKRHKAFGDKGAFDAFVQ